MLTLSSWRTTLGVVVCIAFGVMLLTKKRLLVACPSEDTLGDKV